MRRRTFLKATLATVALAVSAASVTLCTAVADICSRVKSRRRAIKLPPLPKWNSTTDDIDSADFVRRSQDCERALLPPNLVFPRAGQIWKAVRDCQVHVLKYRIGPKGPLFWPNARLRQGERVRILALDHPKPLMVRFQPFRHQESYDTISAQSLHYELSLKTARTVPLGEDAGYFTELFRLVADVV